MAYDKWPVIEEATSCGWRFGALMKFAGEKWGDAFVEAPNGTRAGIIWVMREGPVKMLVAPDSERWGVYDVPFSREMQSIGDVVLNFHAVLPALQELYRSTMANISLEPTSADRSADAAQLRR
jgi:hypothetical protein